MERRSAQHTSRGRLRAGSHSRNAVEFTDTSDEEGEIEITLEVDEEWVQSLPPLTRSLLGAAAPAREERWHSELSPAVRRMLGAGAGPADEEDYHRYLLEKYGR